MAYSKAFFLFGVAFLVVLLISSDVSARELVETTENQATVQKEGVEKTVSADHHGGGGHGCHGHGCYSDGGKNEYTGN
uniref:Ag164 protein homologue n=1 Tax=Datisca glomerata TaxID=34297 RepID=Q7Y081_DATGL|nr:ag164 protein homologue [Datisca glomerata]